jgi:hypothetical protein
MILTVTAHGKVGRGFEERRRWFARLFRHRYDTVCLVCSELSGRRDIYNCD